MTPYVIIHGFKYYVKVLPDGYRLEGLKDNGTRYPVYEGWDLEQLRQKIENIVLQEIKFEI